MFNFFVSPTLPVDPAITKLYPGQPLAYKVISGKLALTKITATNNNYAGAYVSSNGDKEETLRNENISYSSYGFRQVPCAGEVVQNTPIYIDQATGLYSTTVSGNKVGYALSSCTGIGNDIFIYAELIKTL